MSNNINPKKLLNSKWTAINPKDKEKHFIVTEVEYDLDGSVIMCVIEAVLTKSQKEVDWQKLKYPNLWKQGWH
jgi:tryptophan-rich hypothetical protein